MVAIVYDNPSSAYQVLLRMFLKTQDWVTVSPRGMPCREIFNSVTRCFPFDNPIVTGDEKRNEQIRKYTMAEFSLYKSGDDLTEHFAAAAPFWRSVADNEHVNSAYGKIVWFDKTHNGDTPWQWVLQKLESDTDTRQAVLQILQPRHFKETKDFVCTCHLHFCLRGGKLYTTTVMRSNDLVKGFVYDVPWFCHLQISLAQKLNVGTGYYTHIAHSLHMYERDIELAERMLKHD